MASRAVLAPAHRTAWRVLLDDAAKRRWEVLGIAFKSLREQFDTSTALGRLLMNLLASLAEFELELIRERVKAGMDRAARQGKQMGRPKVTDRRGFENRYKTILERLSAGDISRRRAAKELGIGYATLKRLLDSEPGTETLMKP